MSYCVYIAAEDRFTAPIKVGISNNPLRRMVNLNTGYFGRKPLRLIDYIVCPTREDARAIESATMEAIRLLGYRQKGEMFDCQPVLAVGCLSMAQTERAPKTAEPVQIEMFADAA